MLEVPCVNMTIKGFHYKNEIICCFMRETLVRSLFRNLTFTLFFYII